MDPAGLVGPLDVTGHDVEHPATDTRHAPRTVQKRLARAQPVFGDAPVGDVEVHTDDADGFALRVAHGLGVGAQVVDLTAWPHDAEFGVGLPARHHVLQRSLHVRQVIPMHTGKPEVLGPVTFTANAAVEPEHAVIPLHLARHRIELPDADAGAFGGQFEALAVVALGIFGQLAFGDVQSGARHPPGAPVIAAAEELAAVEHPDPVAILVPHADLGFVVRQLTVEVTLQQQRGGVQVAWMREAIPGVNGACTHVG